MSVKRVKHITRIVKQFYEHHSFPGYDYIDNVETLTKKAQQNLYIKLLNEQLPQNDLILEIGCGTGQLANFLGLDGRKIVGVDLSFNSLAHASSFKNNNFIESVNYLQMDILAPCFLNESFDIAISNGVLHHTANPRLAFSSMVGLTKPGGIIILGLYNPFGRALTNLRRIVFHHLGRQDFLDFYLRKQDFPENKKKIWFKDQYQNPQESQHTVDEVLKWFEEEDVSYLNSVPQIIPFKALKKLRKTFSSPKSR